VLMTVSSTLPAGEMRPICLQQNCANLWGRYSKAYARAERLGPFPKPARGAGGRHPVGRRALAGPHPAAARATPRDAGAAAGLAPLPAQPARPAADRSGAGAEAAPARHVG